MIYAATLRADVYLFTYQYQSIPLPASALLHV